eukprot:160497-Amphidinium_carterae.1
MWGVAAVHLGSQRAHEKTFAGNSHANPSNLTTTLQLKRSCQMTSVHSLQTQFMGMKLMEHAMPLHCAFGLLLMAHAGLISPGAHQ